MLLKGLLSLAVLGMLFGGCEDTETTKVEETKPVAPVEQQVEKVTIVETNTDSEFEVLTDLNEEQFGKDLKVEITGTVGRIEGKNKAIEFLLNFDTNTSDYAVLVNVPTSLMEEDFKVGDILTVQGRLGETDIDAFLDGYTTNGDGVHVVRLTAYNIYK